MMKRFKQCIPFSFHPTSFVILILGFASGLPLALTASTLSVWLSESGVDKAAIGFFAAVATPYTLKFLWAPLVDQLPVPLLTRLLGQRRSWLVLTQALLIAALCALGTTNPADNAWTTGFWAVIVAILSATQDIVIDAYRVERLPPEEQGTSAAMLVLGYRIGMIMSSAGALYLATAYGWQTTYWIMGAVLLIGMAAVIIGGEPTITRQTIVKGEKLLKRLVVDPFSEFATRPSWLLILLFIILYKFADAFLGVMSNPFLIEIGFTKIQIANIVKLYGLVATIAGGFIGGWMVNRLGLMRSLYICGIGHALTNLMFVVQAHMGANEQILAIGISLENVTGGMGTAAFVAYLSSLCNRHFTATQYALFSSLAAMGRSWLSTPAGMVAEWLGWSGFFIFATLLALPGLMVLAILQRRDVAMQHKEI